MFSSHSNLPDTMSTEAKALCNQMIDACNTGIDYRSDSDYLQEVEISPPLTIDAACYTRTDTRCNSSQTKKYSNVHKDKTTLTKVVQMVPQIKRRGDLNIIEGNEQKTHVCDVHTVISVNVVTTQKQASEETFLPTPRTSFETPSDNKACDSSESRPKTINKCICTPKEFGRRGTCVYTCTYSCKYGGVGPCHAFSLGSAEARIAQKEACRTMLIGGCRVPVCRNVKHLF